MSKKVTEHLDQFWHFVDEILNAVLFVLLGMEIIVISFDSSASILGVVAIISVLLARLIGTGIIVNFLRKRHDFTDHAVKILTWAGMRGGISVALALSLPESEYRETILTMTYIVVVFSILVQGLTIPKVMKKYSN
jgi:CPA1 family monovalent cation:H+ antiporter